MNWLRSHPYALLFAFAGLTVLVIISTIDRMRAPIVQTSSPITISAGNIAVTEPSAIPNTNAPVTPAVADAPALQAASSTVVHLPMIRDTAPQAQPTEQQNQPISLDFLTQTAPKATATATSTIPQSLTALEALIAGDVPVFGAPQQASVRTPEQQALYAYGNSAGSIVLSFQNAHADMAQTLQTWLDHRSESASQAQVSAIADSMEQAGEALEALSNVPPSAVAANKALGESYSESAAQLRKVVAASGSDSSLASAMQSYDATADQFTKNYVALSDLFTLHEVAFSSSDAGSVFQFSQ